MHHTCKPNFQLQLFRAKRRTALLIIASRIMTWHPGQDSATFNHPAPSSTHIKVGLSGPVTYHSEMFDPTTHSACLCDIKVLFLDHRIVTSCASQWRAGQMQVVSGQTSTNYCNLPKACEMLKRSGMVCKYSRSWLQKLLIMFLLMSFKFK